MEPTATRTILRRRPAGPPRRALALSRPSGFSFLELVVVVAIIALAAAVAMPRYGRALARYRAEVGARCVITALDQARQRARATGSLWEVVFTASGYTVRPVTVVDPADVSTVNLSRDPFLANLQKVNMGGDSTVIFDGYGVPDSGGSLVVASGLGAFQVDLDPQAGKARYGTYKGVLATGVMALGGGG